MLKKNLLVGKIFLRAEIVSQAAGIDKAGGPSAAPSPKMPAPKPSWPHALRMRIAKKLSKSKVSTIARL